MSHNVTQTCQDLLEDRQLFPIENQPDTYCRQPSPDTVQRVERRLERIRAALPAESPRNTFESSGWEEQSGTEAVWNLRQVVDALVAYLVTTEDTDPSQEFPQLPQKVVWWLQIAVKWLGAANAQTVEKQGPGRRKDPHTEQRMGSPETGS